MLIEFKGKRVIVAGAARGIGHGIAVAFAENGGDVIACDRLVEDVEKFAGPAKGGGAITAAKVDVTDKASVEAVVAQAGGPIDVLVYVAGGIRGQKAKPLEQVPVEDFHQIVDANLTGAFLFAQAVTPGMKRAGLNAFGSSHSFSCRCSSHGAIRITSAGFTAMPAIVSGPAAARAIRKAGG